METVATRKILEITKNKTKPTKKSADNCTDCHEGGFPLVALKTEHNFVSWEFVCPRKVTLKECPKESLILDLKRNHCNEYNLIIQFENKLHEVSEDYYYEINLRVHYSQDKRLYHVPMFSFTELRGTDSVIFEDFQLDIRVNSTGFTNIVTYNNIFCLQRAKPLHICCSIRRSNTIFKKSELPRDTLLRENLLSDVCLKVKDREFQVHRAILAMHSTVFRAMFSHAVTSESRTGLVEINDIEAPVLEEMLRYIYTGNLNEDGPKFPVKLLKAAHKYDIDGLVSRCEEALLFQIRFTNVVEFLDLANLYDLKTLKRGAISFISKHEEELIMDPIYQEFLRRDLNVDTFVNTLKLCSKYELPEVKSAAFEFVKRCGKEIMNHEEYLKLLQAHSDFTQEMLVCMHHSVQ